MVDDVFLRELDFEDDPLNILGDLFDEDTRLSDKDLDFLEDEDDRYNDEEWEDIS